MNPTPNGRAALVTGGSGGIGAAICHRLSQAGYAVAVHYNRFPDRAEGVVSAIAAGGGQAEAFGGDVTDQSAMEALVVAVDRRFGPIGVLINNAGVSTPMSLGEMDEAAIARELAVNVSSVALVTQAALPHFSADACIVNVSSNLAFSPLPGMTLYCAAKAAVACLTTGFARELAPRGIRVNAVAPGATRTAMTEWIEPSVMDGIAAQTPLGRIADPADVAGGVMLLVSADAGWVTGQTLLIDGGLI